MRQFRKSDEMDEPFYLAGETAPPGLYVEISSGRQVTLETEDFLPASLNGQVACYRRVSCMWRQIQAPDVSTTQAVGNNAERLRVPASSDAERLRVPASMQLEH